jgi:AraC-like DNA-binding protein
LSFAQPTGFAPGVRRSYDPCVFHIDSSTAASTQGLEALHFHSGTCGLRPYRRLPMPWSALVVSLDDPGSWRPADQRDWRPFPKVALCTATSVFSDAIDQKKGEYRRAIALMEPWTAASLFGLAPWLVHDRVIDLAADRRAWAEDLVHDLGCQTSETAVLRRLATSLQGPRSVGLDDACSSFADAARKRSGSLHVGEAALAAGMPERTFRRHVAMGLGIAPKRWLRLQRVAARLRELHPSSWTGFGEPAEYFDQAHELHEFARMIGITPGRYRRLKAGGDRRVFAYDHEV